MFIVWVVAPGVPVWTFQIISVTEGGRPVHARRAQGDTWSQRFQRGGSCFSGKRAGYLYRRGPTLAWTHV